MTSQHPVDIWACRQCGGRLYQPFCLACNLRDLPCHDVRKTGKQGRSQFGEECRPTQAACGVRAPMPIDLVRQLPLGDQTRYLLRCLKLRPPKLLTVGYESFLSQCRAAGWRGIEPWTAILWCLRRVCPACHDNIVCLEQIVSGYAAGSVPWLQIPRVKLCRPGCRPQDPDLDFAGFAERLAEVRKRKIERGEM